MPPLAMTLASPPRLPTAKPSLPGLQPQSWLRYLSFSLRITKLIVCNTWDGFFSIWWRRLAGVIRLWISFESRYPILVPREPTTKCFTLHGTVNDFCGSCLW